MAEILLYIECDENKILDASYDLITGVKKNNKGANVSGVIVLHPDFILDDEIKNNLKKFGLDKLYILKSEKPFFEKAEEPFLISGLIKNINPEIFVLLSSTTGREIAPIIASILDTGLTADCTKIEIENIEGKLKLISTRPTFGGKLMASIICKRNPQMATVRVGTFKKEEIQNENLEIVEFNFPSFLNLKSEIIEYKKNESGEFINFQNAKMVFAGGLGLKNKENFDKLKLLCEKTGAIMGATRKAVDKGFAEKKYQIGQTGSSTTPEIYVAFGISGAIHHIMGMENSKKVIAINLDKNAPIFKYADIGYIEDAAKVLDELLNGLN